jgi:hypothetical protein
VDDDSDLCIMGDDKGEPYSIRERLQMGVSGRGQRSGSKGEVEGDE